MDEHDIMYDYGDVDLEAFAEILALKYGRSTKQISFSRSHSQLGIGRVEAKWPTA